MRMKTVNQHLCSCATLGSSNDKLDAQLRRKVAIGHRTAPESAKVHPPKQTLTLADQSCGYPGSSAFSERFGGSTKEGMTRNVDRLKLEGAVI